MNPESNNEINGNGPGNGGFGPNVILVRINQHTGTKETGRAAELVRFGSQTRKGEFGRVVMSGGVWESEHNWYRLPRGRDPMKIPPGKVQEKI